MGKRIGVLLLIGVLCFAVACVAIHGSPRTFGFLQISVTDAFLVRQGGLRLGARPVRDDITLVLFDFQTASELGYVHSYEDDVRVYRNLLDAGAQVVFDTRMIATATPEDFATIQPILDSMLTLDDTGRLMRDVWLSSALHEAHGQRYERLLAQNTVNSHPNLIPSMQSRLYPLTYFTGQGARESAPLRILRRREGLPILSPHEVGAELLRCGIMTVWHTHSPDLVPLTDIVKSPYQIGDHSVVWHEFVSTTSLVPPAGFWVSYDPPVAEYHRVSFLDVLKGSDSIDVKDKVVIIGFDADIDPTSDTYEVPSAVGKACAAEVAACATQTLLDGRMIRDLPSTFIHATIALMTISMAIIAGTLRPAQAFVALLAFLGLYYFAATAGYRAGWYTDFAIAPGFGVLSGFLGGTYSAWRSHQTHHRVVDLFGRYVPRAVVQQLMLKPMLESLALGGEQREVTVLFADIRGFTSFSEDLPPEKVVQQLNSLLRIMVDCTFAHEGTLDKFIGDAILVLFNAPLDQPDHALRAVQTAVDIQEKLRGHQSGLGVGIGVHSGEAVVGSIGTPQRMEYTAIGSTVNIASRLCDIARSGEVVISSTVLDAIADRFDSEPLPPVAVKGIKQPLSASRIVRAKIH